MNKDKIAVDSDNFFKPQTSALFGLILSGGLSTRMGVDKADLHYHNKTQRKYLYELLSAYCEATFISCNAEQANSIIDIPKIVDTFLNLGPLGGILSAFQNQPGNAFLTVPCDLPFLNDETITYLIKHRDFSKMATVFFNPETKFLEPLVAIWEPGIYNILLKFLAQGCSSPSKILMNSDIKTLNVPDDLALKNINTIEDYEEAMILLCKKAFE